MPFESLRDYMEALDNAGKLKRVRAKVNPNLEVAEIMRRAMYARSQPAILFENVQESSMPILGNAFGTMDRLHIALETSDFTEIGGRIVQLTKFKIPPGRLDKLRMLPKLSEIADYGPKQVDSGPITEIIKTDNASFDSLPILKKSNKKIEVAVAIGADPATIFSAVAPVPEGLDKFLFSGITRKKGIKLVKCSTVDLEVPANAEIVLEGYVSPNDVVLEGPFGDHTGYYTPPELFPTFTLTAIMQRHDPIYMTTVVGKPILEDAYIGKVIERSFLPLIQMLQPEVVDISMPPECWFQGLAVVSVRKRYPGQAKKVMMGLWGMGQLSLTKIFVVVDPDIDVHNMREVLWAITTRADPKRDTMIIDNTPTDTLDPASPLPNLGSKMGIDATTKWRDEGYAREAQELAAVDDETRSLVNSRWKEYGFV